MIESFSHENEHNRWKASEADKQRALDWARKQEEKVRQNTIKALDTNYNPYDEYYSPDKLGENDEAKEAFNTIGINVAELREKSIEETFETL